MNTRSIDQSEKRFVSAVFQKTINTTKEDLDNFIIRGIFSTGTIDRHGEIVDQKGWILKDFYANPVVLFNHDHRIPAIGKIIELSITSNGLEGAIQFAAKETAFAREIFNLYAGGFMNAFSCGFMNEVYEYDQNTDTIILKENSLFEISCVNVPANALALAKSFGMDTAQIESREKGCPCDDKKDGEECPDGECGTIDKEDNVDDVETVMDDSGEEVISQDETDTAMDSVKTVLSSITKAESRKGITKREMVLMINKGVKELLQAKKNIRS